MLKPKRLAILILVMFFASFGECRGWDKKDTLLTVTAAADLLTTEVGISKGIVHEGNPILRQRGVRIGVIAGHTLLSLWLRRKTGKDGWVLYPIIVHSAAAGWNTSFFVRYSW